MGFTGGVWVLLLLLVTICQSLPLNDHKLGPIHSEVKAPLKNLNPSDRKAASGNQSRTVREITCETDEYLFRSYCCKYCPAGTYVFRGCQVPHTVGDCHVCTNGEDHSEHANGLDRCIPCSRCREDQEVVVPCSVAKDTVCQCKPGTFCLPHHACEVCRLCSKRCSDGMVVLKECNATVDTVCGPPAAVTHTSPGSTAIIVAVFLFMLGLTITLISYNCKKRNGCLTGNRSPETDHSQKFTAIQIPLLQDDNQVTDSGVADKLSGFNPPSVSMLEDPPCLAGGASPVSSNVASAVPPQTCEESPQSHQPAMSPEEEAASLRVESSNMVDSSEMECLLRYTHLLKEVKDKPQDALTSSFYSFIDEVPIKEWKTFMRRLKLKDNEIEAAVRNNCNDVVEQHYQMLCTWQDKSGKDATIYVLLQVLLEMGLKGCAENIVNTLINKGIYK